MMHCQIFFNGNDLKKDVMLLEYNHVLSDLVFVQNKKVAEKCDG